MTSMFLTFIQLIDKRPLRCDVPSDLIILVSTSFLSVSPQSGVALSSFKYPLKEALMERGGRGRGGGGQNKHTVRIRFVT